jgi:hypothetical protein
MQNAKNGEYPDNGLYTDPVYAKTVGELKVIDTLKNKLAYDKFEIQKESFYSFMFKIFYNKYLMVGLVLVFFALQFKAVSLAIELSGTDISSSFLLGSRFNVVNYIMSYHFVLGLVTLGMFIRMITIRDNYVIDKEREKIQLELQHIIA